MTNRGLFCVMKAVDFIDICKGRLLNRSKVDLETWLNGERHDGRSYPKEY